jgi:hypothetical protein
MYTNSFLVVSPLEVSEPTRHRESVTEWGRPSEITGPAHFLPSLTQWLSLWPSFFWAAGPWQARRVLLVRCLHKLRVLYFHIESAIFFFLIRQRAFIWWGILQTVHSIWYKFHTLPTKFNAEHHDAVRQSIWQISLSVTHNLCRSK